MSLQNAKRALIDWLIEDQQRKGIGRMIIAEELGGIPLHLLYWVVSISLGLGSGVMVGGSGQGEVK